jgi:NAD(P)-dependent dehydrogenase (short-subunit alcohol dehydrogenase family)
MPVLVAGGTGHLGTAVVRELLAGGYAITATWVVESEAERLSAEPVELVHADLFDPDAVQKAVDSTPELEAVVNLVGGYAEGPRVHETDPDQFDGLMKLNVKPGFLLARTAMPRLIERGGGAFVGVSARAALRPFPGAAAYIASKAAVLALIQALDAEYKRHGIRCNAILPSVIDTPPNRAAQPDADYSKWVQPEEIAKVVRFLISDESGPISGAAVPVYGRA